MMCSSVCLWTGHGPFGGVRGAVGALGPLGHFPPYKVFPQAVPPPMRPHPLGCPRGPCQPRLAPLQLSGYLPHAPHRDCPGQVHFLSVYFFWPCLFAEEARRGETGSNSSNRSGKLTLAVPVACFGFGGQFWHRPQSTRAEIDFIGFKFCHVPRGPRAGPALEPCDCLAAADEGLHV